MHYATQGRTKKAAKRDILSRQQRFESIENEPARFEHLESDFQNCTAMYCQKALLQGRVLLWRVRLFSVFFTY
jgi:hypothetical protein